MRHLFFVGNKRSGTTLLTRLLNVHPNVFILQETDVPWILFQMQRVCQLQAYAWDDGFLMRKSFLAYGDMLDSTDPEGSLLKVAQHVSQHGGHPGHSQPPVGRRDLQVIGDKKPYTYADPAVHRWLKDTFKEAMFVHVYRHPWASISSMHETGLIAWWRRPIPEVIKGWVQHEQRALEAADISIRYEDLCQDPVEYLNRIYSLLLLDRLSSVEETQVLASVRKETYGERQLIEDFPYSDDLLELMDGYGYERDVIPSN